MIAERINNMKHEILNRVAEQDGKMDWYRLDRALAYGENLEVISRLTDLVGELESEGLLQQVGEGARPKYHITEAGRVYLETMTQSIAAKVNHSCGVLVCGVSLAL